MNLKIKLILVLILSVLSCKRAGEGSQDLSRDDASSKLIEAESLMQIYLEPGWSIIDFRKPEFYQTGHIPGSVNIWRTHLSNEDYPYAGMMPTRVEFENTLRSLGIKNQDTLIIYDDKGSVDAARLWWLLRYYDFHEVRILNGGLSAWKAQEGPISEKKIIKRPSEFTLVKEVNNEILIDKDELLQNVLVPARPVKIVDVRSDAEYRGSTIKTGAFKAGRIPGSIHLEWSESIDPDNQNKFRDYSYLDSLFSEKGLKKDDTIVVYCHSGSRSAHTAFVLEELLKYRWVKNYDGSWTEWSYFDELPIERDSLILKEN